MNSMQGIHNQDASYISGEYVPLQYPTKCCKAVRGQGCRIHSYMHPIDIVLLLSDIIEALEPPIFFLYGETTLCSLS